MLKVTFRSPTNLQVGNLLEASKREEHVKVFIEDWFSKNEERLSVEQFFLLDSRLRRSRIVAAHHVDIDAACYAVEGIRNEELKAAAKLLFEAIFEQNWNAWWESLQEYLDSDWDL